MKTRLGPRRTEASSHNGPGCLGDFEAAQLPYVDRMISHQMRSPERGIALGVERGCTRVKYASGRQTEDGLQKFGLQKCSLRSVYRVSRSRILELWSSDKAETLRNGLCFSTSSLDR